MFHDFRASVDYCQKEREAEEMGGDTLNKCEGELLILRATVTFQVMSGLKTPLADTGLYGVQRKTFNTLTFPYLYLTWMNKLSNICISTAAPCCSITVMGHKTCICSLELMI